MKSLVSFAKFVIALGVIGTVTGSVEKSDKLLGPVNIDIHCTPASGWTCKLYNCDGSYSGLSCGPTGSNGKCFVGNVTEGCYYFVIDNGGTNCTGGHFNYSGFGPFTMTFTVTIA